MRCYQCGHEAFLVTPDYGFGRGVEYRCYNASGHRFGEFTFSTNDPGVSERDAKAAEDESRESLATSKANAAAMRERGEF